MKVWPKNNDIRKTLKHPAAGGFRDQGSANWPDDQFTTRRIADGSVSDAEPQKEEPVRAERKRAQTEEPPKPAA